MSIPPIHYRGSVEILPCFSIDLEAGRLEAHFPPFRLLAPPVNSTSLTLHLSWVLVFGWVRFLDLSLVPNITLKEHAFFLGLCELGSLWGEYHPYQLSLDSSAQELQVLGATDTLPETNKQTNGLVSIEEKCRCVEEANQARAGNWHTEGLLRREMVTVVSTAGLEKTSSSNKWAMSVSSSLLGPPPTVCLFDLLLWS